MGEVYSLKITVLIGNGLDVSLGIKSSYGDFYKWYCNQKSKVAHIQKFRDDIKEDISRDVPDDEKTWSDFELGLGKYTEEFSVDNVSDFVDCLEDAQSSIRDYLHAEQNKFVVGDFTDESVSAFRLNLAKFFAELPEIERDAVQSSLNGARQENKEIQFITFNYTDSIERILENLPNDLFATWNYGSSVYGYKINKTVHHVHGTVNEFPVLGVNDESQIANKQLLDVEQFKDFMIKADNITALGLRWHSVAENHISQSRVVCVFGMSMGASDAKWWKKLAFWMLPNPERHLVLYWYMKDPPNRIQSIKQLKVVNMVKDQFLRYADNMSVSDKQKIKARIHVVINTKQFLTLERKPKKGNVLSPVGVSSQLSIPEPVELLAPDDSIVGKYDEIHRTLEKIFDTGEQGLIDAYNRDLEMETIM